MAVAARGDGSLTPDGVHMIPMTLSAGAREIGLISPATPVGAAACSKLIGAAIPASATCKPACKSERRPQ